MKTANQTLETLPRTTESRTITVQELRKILRSQTEYIFDPVYKLPSKAELVEMVRDYIRWRGEFDYVSNYHDCDNAAAEMMTAMSGLGWPFGMAVIPGHALCVGVTDELKTVFIEPQNGSVVSEPKQLLMVLMV